MCMRNYRGADFNGGYPLTELSLADIHKIFPRDFLQQIERINFNGNLGDFGLAHDALDIVNYMLENTTASINIETNGGMRTPDWWAQLANSRISVMFALDGLADTHSLYRQDTDWQRVIDNAQALIQAGGRAIWKFIPFEHNEHQIESCRTLCKELGFESFAVYDQGRNRGPVFNRDGTLSHWLGPQQPDPDFGDMLESHVTWFDKNKDWSFLPQGEINCFHKSNQEIYIAADGSVYPCCWLGFYPKTMRHPGMKQVAPLLERNNALEHDLASCLEWFEKVEKTWNRSSVSDGRLFTCVSTCVNRNSH